MSLLRYHTVFALILAGCMSTYNYGVYEIDNIFVEQVQNGYHVSFVVHVGKDASHYTVDYYVSGHLLYSSRTEVNAPRIAQYSVGYGEQIFINEPAKIRVLVRSYVGTGFIVTDEQEFYLTDMDSFRHN